jgi:hypothetical protein
MPRGAMENLTAYENESSRYVGRAVRQWLSAFVLFFVPQPTNLVHSLRLYGVGCAQGVSPRGV